MHQFEDQSVPDLPERLQTLVQSLQAQPHINPEIARECLLAAQLQTADLMAWADYQHPVTDSYGRRMVYDGGTFEIMVMSWSPGDFSAIHDHGAAEWGAVQAFGLAEHWIYHLEDLHLTTVARVPFEPRQVVTVNPELIHQMGNPGASAFLSLHVYGSTHAVGAVTGGARIFDLLEHSIQHTDGGVFFGLPESEITHRIWGLSADTQTTLRHHQQMLSRVHRQLLVSGNTGRLWKLSQLLRQEIATLNTATPVG